ncbi:MAG TPA: SCO family protein [Humisphaera sp.]|nr:SCO family protein [Humisphaera sp.]
MSFAQVPPPPAPVDARPSVLEKVGIDQKLGDQVPGDLLFKDEAGHVVRLNEYYGKRPTVLVLAYFQCPMLCTMVLNDLLRTVRAMSENVGTNFDILTVSFDPSDTPRMAALKKETYLAQYDRSGAENAWHFLTGDQASITALTKAVGFRYVWDPKSNTFAHASGIMVLTPEGKISRYFYGIDYAPQDLRLAVLEASGGKTGSLADQTLLYCFHYDPATGRYGLAINRALKAGGLLTVLLIGSTIGFFLRRDRRSMIGKTSGSGNSESPPFSASGH